MHSTAGDEFILVGAFSRDLKFSGGELVNEIFGSVAWSG